MDNYCRDCFYFKAMEDGVNGTCHYHAPRPTTAGLNVTRWPQVKATDFCGDYICAEDLEDDV